MATKDLMFIQAPIQTRSGYGAHARDIVRSLMKMDRWDIKIASLRWGSCPMDALDENNPEDKAMLDKILTGPNLPRQPEVHLEIRVPNEFCNPGPVGKFNIGITAGIETTMCSKDWIDGLNRCDLVIVPSEHSKTVFNNTKYQQVNNQTQQVEGEIICQKPVEVLFEGADDNVYKKTDKIPEILNNTLNQIKEDFCFLYVGHWLKGDLGQDRKDTGMLVKTFLETFKNKQNAPALIMKTSGAGFSIIDRDEIMKKIEGIKKTVQNVKIMPKIYFLHGDLTDEEMNGLYNHPKVKAHVSFTKGEGFGRPLLEASISQKPVIASGWSGHLDFLNKENALLLPGQLTNVHESSAWENVILTESKWFTVNYPVASKVLSDMWLNYSKYERGAKKLGTLNAKKFSLDAMTTEFEKILDKHLPQFPKQVEIKLPDLKKVTLPKKEVTNEATATTTV